MCHSDPPTGLKDYFPSCWECGWRTAIPVSSHQEGLRRGASSSVTPPSQASPHPMTDQSSMTDGYKTEHLAPTQNKSEWPSQL